MRFLINSLSASVPYGSANELEVQLRRVTECFELLLPMINAQKLELIYDNSIETRSLLFGEDGLPAALARISDSDVRKRWYHYTKNKSSAADREHVHIILSGGGGVLRGVASASLMTESHVIGLGGSDVHEARQFEVKNEEDVDSTNKIESICDSTGAWRQIPRYEASPKHRRESYVREGGEEVSPMTLDDAQAQRCLFQAIEHGGEYFGKYGRCYFRFLLTVETIDGPIYHGFEVSTQEVPEKIILRLEALPDLDQE